mgnify:CR=1 FL=1
MKEHELERIMTDFINGEIDVLVSTTIIETGLDIPNANTMIIHDADHMDFLSCTSSGAVWDVLTGFLMRFSCIREISFKGRSRKALQAIREFTELGSGIKIAMRDLEIRGAGMCWAQSSMATWRQ